MEIDPNTENVVWKLDGQDTGVFNREFFSDIVCNAQRLRSGNTLVCSGVRGRLFEVAQDGEIVWEYMSPYSIPFQPATYPNTRFKLVYRAYRVDASWPPLHRGARSARIEGRRSVRGG